jgi:sugar (pentulose or hexulose) kinase
MTARADCVVGVDIGTQSTKALVVDASGRVLGEYAQAYPLDTPHPGWAQQDADDWLRAVVACVRGAVERAGVAAGAFRALGVSSLGGGSGVPVDASGAALHPCLIWMDRRAQAQAAAVRASPYAARLREISGNEIDSFYGFTKMLWLREERAHVWSRIRHFVPPNTYVTSHLTGQVAVDHSSAGNIGAVYDIAARAWSREALDALEIPAHFMPQRLADPQEVIGTLQPRWASQLGLPSGLPVIAGGVDAACATLAAGGVRRGDHVTMLGTSMCWGAIRGDVSAGDGLVSFPHVLRPRENIYVFGGAVTAGGAISWLRDAFCHAEIAQARASGADVHTILDAAASALAPGGDGLLFLPHLMGERGPVWDADARGCFIGLALNQSRPHLHRAVLEGIAFALRHTLEAGACGDERLAPQLRIVGGLSRSDLCMQVIADACNRHVATLGAHVEAPLGVAMLATLGVGLIDEAAIERGWAQPVERARPDARRALRYDALYAQYRAAYEALRPVFRELQR